MSKKIIITGTHHTPAIELIKLLQSDSKTNWEINYIGHQYSAETHILHTIIPKLKVPFYNLDSGKFDRKNLWPTIQNIPKIVVSFFKALSLINQIKPDIVVSFGGYVSVPVIVAAFVKRVPSLTHEQTLTTSLSTKINSYFVNKVALSFENNDHSSKTVVTGNLIRDAIFDQSSTKFKNLKLKIKNLPLIYVTGGNQGSEFINQLTLNLLPSLTNFSIIHQTGNKIVTKTTHQNYHHYEYIEIEDIGWVLNHADIIISRAGANTCQEIDLLNKNVILIPHPATQQNEQFKNALWLQLRHPKTTVIINQLDATPSTIISAINKFPKNKQNLTFHQPQSQHLLLSLIYDLI